MELVRITHDEIQASVDTYTTGLVAYLDALSLPTTGVLVPVQERGKVFANLPEVVCQIPATRLAQSVYVSKFVSACGAGLFDAALNFLWDETVKNLRDKVAHFDIDYFFDSVVTNPDRRKKLKGEDDLGELDDWELVRGCHLTGILSDIGFKHLDYIRNMRNWASAAHPNQNALTGLQLVSWLETCIREVIGKEPAGPVIEVKRLLHNIRTSVLASSDVPPIIANIELLPHDLGTSLLRTVFGMFVDPGTPTEVKNNIRLIAGATWNSGPDESKQEIGVKYSIFAANGDIARRDAAKEFLQNVDGLKYLPPDTLAMEITEKVNNLYTAHIGYNNFHAEPAHARALVAYIPGNGVVPDAVRFPYVKTLTMCYMGNGYGISNMAYSEYETLIARFQDREIHTVCQLPRDAEVASRLQFDSCIKRFRKLLSYLKPRTSNVRIIECIEYLESRTDEQLSGVGNVTEYKRLLGIK